MEDEPQWTQNILNEEDPVNSLELASLEQTLLRALQSHESDALAQQITRNSHDTLRHQHTDLEQYKDRVEVMMREEFFVLRTQVAQLREEVMGFLSRMDIKKCKKNRTQRNRCTFVGKKPCSGYICKKSTRFCYSHHMLATAKSR